MHHIALHMFYHQCDCMTSYFLNTLTQRMEYKADTPHVTYVPVAQWLEHCVSSTKVVGSNPREHTYWQYKCITWMHCKSLWIKASAKYINVNVNMKYKTESLHKGNGESIMHVSMFHITLIFLHIFACSWIKITLEYSYFERHVAPLGDPGAWLISERFSSVRFPTTCHEMKAEPLALVTNIEILPNVSSKHTIVLPNFLRKASRNA